MPRKNFSNISFRKLFGIFIAATIGFLAISVVGAYWAMGVIKNSQPVPSANVNAAAKQTVRVYFGNSNLNKDMTDCGLVFPIDRVIDQTPAAARSAILELLSGPTLPESNGGYFSSINPGVNLNYIGIIGTEARIDFDAKMDENMGGSCRVAAIRAQITQTLMQFPTIKSVVISVNGNSEEALQP